MCVVLNTREKNGARKVTTFRLLDDGRVNRLSNGGADTLVKPRAYVVEAFWRPRSARSVLRSRRLDSAPGRRCDISREIGAIRAEMSYSTCVATGSERYGSGTGEGGRTGGGVGGYGR